MLADILKTLVPFADLGGATLVNATRLAEQHGKLLAVPRRRWLVRKGQSFNRTVYLVDGHVVRNGERVGPGSTPIYRVGDEVEVITHADVRILAIDMAPIEFFLGETSLPLAVVDEPDPWLVTLLSSPVLRPLPGRVLQRLLRSAREVDITAGALVDCDDGVFVVKHGAVEVEGRRIGPGGYFGEDTVLGGRSWDGRLRALGEVCLLRIPGAEVRALIESYPARRQQGQHAQVLDLDTIRVTVLRERMDGFDPNRDVLIQRGTVHARALAFAILTEAGFRAVPV
jgi:CRP-like cAMP-binding protein